MRRIPRWLPLVAVGGFLYAQAATGQTLDPRIQTLLEEISAERLGRTVETLASFGTRHTLSRTDSPTQGIGAARQWILEQFKAASPRLEVSYDVYQVVAQGRIGRDVELRNVVAVLPGASSRRIYISGHYDTVARDEKTNRFDWGNADLPAPGANDDGSGTALVLEMARVFGASDIPFDATLVFIAFAGEEEGLVGATLHAARAEREGWTIDAVFNNDIVGGSVGGDGLADTRAVRVFSEGPADSPSRQVARHIREVAARYVPGHDVRLIARHDRFGRGGDHTAFNQHGFAGVRFTETRENYSRQHTVEDTPAGVFPEYLARNARVNAAAVASLALAPPAPVVTSERGAPMLGRGRSGYDATLVWQPVKGATGYRIVWRSAWSLDWEHEQIVPADTTRFTLPGVSIDDDIFGVAAIGAGGLASLVSAYVNPPRRRLEVKTR